MRALIVIPLYNEEASVAGVLLAVQRHAPPGTDVLVVDDGSTDRSAERLVACAGVRVLRHETRQGYGAALIAGFRHALERGYEAVLTMDCDEQHEPHHIPELIAGLAEADIVSGSRYLAGSARRQEAPAERRRINREVTALVNGLTGLGLTDAFCGFKAYRAGALARLELDEPSYGLPLQIWIQAARLDLRVREVAMGRIYRNLGRNFPGELADPAARLCYYRHVLEREAARWPRRSSS